MEVLTSAQNAVRKSFLLATAILLLAGLFSAPASAGLLFDTVPVSDAGTDNSIASGNTTRNLAVGADGTIYAVYRGPTGGIRVARSVDRGASFQPSVQVSSQNFEAEIAVSTTGIIYVVWADSSGRARISRSLDDGLSFSAPLDAGPSTGSVHMATDGSRVYLIDRPGNNILVSEDNGLSFSQVALNASQVFSDIHVDEQTREVIAVLDNPAVKYFISSDFGASFGAQINPSPGGDIFFSVGTVSSGSGGRFMFVSGQGTDALKINLDTDTSETLTFGNNTSSQGRSLTSDRCGNVIDGFVDGGNVNFRISNDLGVSFGSQQTVAAANAANVFINPTNGDILYLFDQGGEVFLSVFNEELGNCYTPTLNKSALVFSALLVGQTSQPQQVVISNTGIVDVEIQGISSTSAEFSQTNSCVGTLAVGASCPIDVTFSPSGTGTRTGDLLIDTNVFVDARQVSLTGEGVATAPVPQFSTGSIDFGAVLTGSSANASVNLSNTGSDDLTINGFNIPAPFSVVSEDCGATLTPAASCTIDLAFTPISPGSFNGSLVLDSNAAGAPASVALTGVGSTLFSVAGNVSGLTGTGLVLQNNGGDDLAISADGAFVFSTELADGSSYDVSVLNQPTAPNQTCSVSNGSGTINGADVTDITVTCSTAQFTIGGTVSGLLGGGLVLQNNAGDDLAISADGNFTFATALDDGSAYSVSVFTQPGAPSQTCTVSNGSGTLAGADVIDVAVTCVTDQFTVGGNVSGLLGTGLVLQNNGGDDLAIAADGSFSFATALDDGSAYGVTVLTQPSAPSQTCTVSNGSGTLAGADVTDVAVTCVTDQFTVGGNVSGLLGTGLVLQNNGGDDLAIAADGSFSFATALDDGSAYNVSVFTQPASPSQTCSVSNGAGTLAGADVTDVAVTCVTDQFTVGGNVSGLLGSGLVLQNNAGDDLAITADGSFSFATALDDGSAYNVSVFTQPASPSQTCSVSNGAGTLAGADVTDVAVTCVTDQFTVGGNVSGLTGTGLVLQNNAGDDLAISADGSFSFATALDDESAYDVTVLTQPSVPSQTCSVSNGSGTLAGADVTDVAVTCTTDQFTVGGDVSGLTGTGLVLQNNGGDDLAISADGAFTFATALDDETAYDVTVLTQPSVPSQTCTVSNGSGTLAGADVTDVGVTCVTDQFTVGGNVSGLLGSGLVLQNNAGDDLAISADGSFSFATALDDESAYDVTVLTQPSVPSQTCSVSNGSGSLAGADVTDVAVTCTTDQFTVGGDVSGLAGTGLVLQNNAGDDLAISADGAFTFATALDDETAYDVTVLTQPSVPSQTCTVSNGSGSLAGADVTDVAVTCTTDQFTVGGNVSGLLGSGLVLQNNAGDDLAITADGSFSFATALEDESAYDVTVLTQPSVPSQTCSVSNGSGSLAGADVTDVAVTCTTDQFTVGGNVSGLLGSGLVLQNNAGDDLTISGDGAFTFATALDDLSTYAVTVATQPDAPSQTCVVENGSGSIEAADINNVSVNCTTDEFSIGGSITGLQPGSFIVLQNNAMDTLKLVAGGTFTFSNTLPDLSSYEVTVLAQPFLQNCDVANGVGTLAGADVTDVTIRCEQIGIDILPEKLSFGDFEIGDISPNQMAVIENTGNVSFEIMDISLFGTDSGDFILSMDTCSDTVLDPDDFCGLEVAFAPSDNGIREAEIIITTDLFVQTFTIRALGTSGVLFFDGFEDL